jgi:rod shape-determining protein MreC
VKPAAHLDRLDEVLIITSTEPRFPAEQKQDMATSETLKGAQAEEENAQRKASEIMAERLPGLIDPNLPPDQQPLNDTSNPNPVAHPPLPLHPDRFTPGAEDSTLPAVVPADGGQGTPEAKSVPLKKAVTPAKASGDPAGPTPKKPEPSAEPRRNP